MLKIMIIHSSDQHLDKRQYNFKQRYNDFLSAWISFVEQVMILRPDIVTLGGDLFDNPTPRHYTVQVVESSLIAMQEMGISVYAITGNHEERLPSDQISIIQKLHQSNKLVLVNDGYVLDKTGIPIFGINYSGLSINEKIKSLIPEIKKFSFPVILLLHAGIKQRSDIDPLGFDYNLIKGLNQLIVLTGHIHDHYIYIEDKEKDPVVVSPGTLETCSITEYNKNNQGFTKITINDTIFNIEQVATKRRKFLVKEIEASEDIDKLIKDIKDLIDSLQEISIVKIKIVGSIKTPIPISYLSDLLRTDNVMNSDFLLDRTGVIEQFNNNIVVSGELQAIQVLLDQNNPLGFDVKNIQAIKNALLAND